MFNHYMIKNVNLLKNFVYRDADSRGFTILLYRLNIFFFKIMFKMTNKVIYHM